MSLFIEAHGSVSYHFYFRQIIQATMTTRGSKQRPKTQDTEWHEHLLATREKNRIEAVLEDMILPKDTDSLDNAKLVKLAENVCFKL